MAFTEENALNLIAAQERSIAGVKNSYDYAQNPDVITEYPCVIHYIPRFTATPLAHYNVWNNELNFTSILYVLPRQAQGGKLKFVENEVIPFGAKWRSKFQDSTVITNLLSQMGAKEFFLQSGDYGVGGALLQYNGVEFSGWVFQWTITSA